jgi:5-methyltetrahydrofolate--homocysteine methyltransferase
MHTLAAMARIKSEIPGAFTVLGVSNVSFGLSGATRQVLNSVFLHEAVQAGLDAAIVHAGRIQPLNKIPEDQRQVCLDLIYDRRADSYDPLARLLEVFADVTSTTTTVVDRSSWTVQERLKHRIIDGDRQGLSADLDEAMAAGHDALSIVNDILLDGMKTVGELFGSGQMQLPFVLQSAETMKTAVAYLEPHMETSGHSSAKGSVVLATVRGDVHDIGKNLVDIILTNNGYQVHNLGIKVGIAEMIDAVNRTGADALGMSGLLVKSTLIMRENLEELNQRGLSDIPVLLGGAALTRSYVENDLRSVYQGRVFYGRDAFEGLHTMDQLMAMKRSGEWDPAFGRTPSSRTVARRRERAESAGPAATTRSADVAPDNEVFTPPFVGSRVVKGIALDDIAAYINETALFRNQWQFRPESGETDEEFKVRIRALLRQRLATAKAAGILVPQVVYGYFPANSVGNDLVVWTDETRSHQACRFSFPRQSEAPHLCIADFVRPLGDGPGPDNVDYAAFHIVTMGAAVSEHASGLLSANEYQEYLFTHGLGVEMTEALAEYWHRRIREEWGFADQDGPTLAGLFRQQYRGGRYSWGYPACPDLEDNATVATLLGADRIGIEVNEETGWQYQPEQTTSAIILHHPQAKYFVAR